MPSISRSVAAAAVILAWVSPASARVATSSIGVSATVVDTCLVNGQHLASGGSPSVACLRGTEATVGLAHDDRTPDATMGYGPVSDTGHGDVQSVRFSGSAAASGQALLLTVTY
jgi:hypothetical protein